MLNSEETGLTQDYMGSKKLHTAIGLGVSIGLVSWMVFALDWAEIGDEIAQMQFLYLLPIAILLVLHFVLRAYRWRYLLPETTQRVPLVEHFNAILVGNFASYVLPLRIGEIIRPYVFSLRTEHSFPSGFVSVVIERFFDLTVVLATFGIVVMYVPNMPEWVHDGAGILSVLAAGILIFMILGALLPDRILGLTQIVLRFLPERFRDGISKFLDDFLRGAVVLADIKRLFMVTALSIAIWLSGYAFYYLFLLLFNQEGNFLAATTITVVIALAVAAPSAPGFIGVYQIACIAAFVLFGLDKEVGTAFAIVSHLIQYIFFVFYGMWVLSRYNLSLRSLRTRATERTGGAET